MLAFWSRLCLLVAKKINSSCSFKEQLDSSLKFYFAELHLLFCTDVDVYSRMCQYSVTSLVSAVVTGSTELT